MAASIVVGLFVTPIVENLVKGLANILKDEVLTVLGVKKELEVMERKMKKIMVIIQIAERQSLYDETTCIWMPDLKDILYDMDDIIDDCKVKAQVLASTSSTSMTSSTQHGSFSRLKNLKFSHKIGKRIKEINVKMEEIARENQVLRDTIPDLKSQHQSDNAQTTISKTTHFLTDDVVGCVNEDATKLVQLVLDEKESHGRTCVSLAIIGMGGIGKTTLAQKMFQIVTQSGKFQQKMWICVSKHFEELSLLKEIIWLAGGKYGGGEGKEALANALEETVKDKKFFLVLDDVWDADVWDDLLKGPLKSSAKGSKIIITTRDVNVAKTISASHHHDVKLLSIEDGWSLLCKNVFRTINEGNNDNLKDIGLKIVQKCGQLPLTIRTIAGLLKTKEQSRSEWEEVLFSEVWSKHIFEDNRVMNALYLSYKDLSSQLKKCFVYCSLFPEDHIFDKTNLVGMWFAEGFIEGKTPFEMGEDLHKELVNRNLLQQEKFANRHKMHDLLRSLGQFLGKGEIFYGNKKDIDKSVRHLSIQYENSLVDDDPQWLRGKIRTLMLVEGSKLEEVPSRVFQKLRYLRVLSLSGTGIHVLPDSIKNLVHLRYLDLSNSKIRIISESIGDLRNLQFLFLAGCEFLEKLPKSIINLQNLISLEHSLPRISQMPKGLGRLKQLRSLVFKVAENENEAELGCTMQELQSLMLLKDLWILNLQAKLSLNEIRSVELVKKNHLQNLTLSCKAVEDASAENINIITEIFEEFCPPPNLEYLFIVNFYGHNLPKWMTSSSGISLGNLVQLEIKGCERCQQFPGLGKLPQLEVLRIYEASSIQNLGPEFLGGVDRSTAPYFHPFPKLQSLKLNDLPELKEWHWDEADDGEDGRRTPFPCLQYIFVENCPKLRSLPLGLQHAASLIQLVLDGNTNLAIVPELPSLKDLFMTNCSSMQHVGNLNALEYFALVDEKLGTLPSWLRSLATSNSSKAPSGMPSLQKMFIGTGELQLLRRLCPWDIGSDCPLIEAIPLVFAQLVGKDFKAGVPQDYNLIFPHTPSFTYYKSPLTIVADLPNFGLQGVRANE